MSQILSCRFFAISQRPWMFYHLHKSKWKTERSSVTGTAWCSTKASSTSISKLCDKSASRKKGKDLLKKAKTAHLKELVSIIGDFRSSEKDRVNKLKTIGSTCPSFSENDITPFKTMSNDTEKIKQENQKRNALWDRNLSNFSEQMHTLEFADSPHEAELNNRQRDVYESSENMNLDSKTNGPLIVEKRANKKGKAKKTPKDDCAIPASVCADIVTLSHNVTGKDDTVAAATKTTSKRGIKKNKKTKNAIMPIKNEESTMSKSELLASDKKAFSHIVSMMPDPERNKHNSFDEEIVPSQLDEHFQEPHLETDLDGGLFEQIDGLDFGRTESTVERDVTKGCDSVTGTLWREEDLTTTEDIRNITSNVLKVFQGQLSKQLKKTSVESAVKRRQDMHNQDVAAFVNACIGTGMTRKAHTVVTVPFLNQQKGRGGKSSSRQPLLVRDVSVYNAVIHAWAKQGKLSPIKRLFSQMIELGVTPNLQSYAGCLECLGRHADCPQTLIQNVLDDIEDAGLDIRNVVKECQFTPEQWKYVKMAIHGVLTGFSPHPPEEQGNYECDLMDALNFSEKPIFNPSAGIHPTTEVNQKLLQQIRLEMQDHVIIKSIIPEPANTDTIIQARKKLQDAKKFWKEILLKSFERNRHYLEQKNKGSHKSSLVPYLRLFPPSTYIDFMLHEVEMLGETAAIFSPTLPFLCSRLGRRFYQKMLTQSKSKSGYLEKVEDLYPTYLEKIDSDMLTGNHRQIWQQVQKDCGKEFSHISQPEWPYRLSKSLGRFLYNIILADVKIDANMLNEESSIRSVIPAFYTIYRMRNDLTQEEIKPHPVLVRLYEECKLTDITFDPGDMPSLVSPLPWTTYKNGGNLLSTTSLVKNPALCHHQIKELGNLPANHLYPVLDSINAVSATPWVINKPVLDIIIKLFLEGGDTSLNIPQPASCLPEPPHIQVEMSQKEKLELIVERNANIKKRQEMHSLWRTELLRFSIANKYKDDIFWFPHNLDFRGRVYACPPHFNHLGSDVARSILKFGKGKPLGQDGLDWLKIHLVNLTGLKKRSSNVDRLAFANDMMPEVLDSADNPLQGKGWWRSSGEPWQTLACCKEIAEATRSADPASFVCSFPVHQDGSCNGLQHYAALGRDSAGAESVNLSPFPTPKDVYSDVVELVERERQRDSKNDNAIADLLDTFVERKVIKQTVMTTVYGVTKYGARAQIRGQLGDISVFPQKHTWDAGSYLTNLTFKCLQKMFISTKEIQDWLVLCAELISKVSLQPVSWVTPLGFPVIQPYFHHARSGGITIEKPNAMKQKNAYPPNFIHSLDSVHMMLTALHCLHAGITFVSVHDCFWTHACDIPILNKICREQFVAMHEQPILEELSYNMQKQFGFTEEQMKQSKQATKQSQAFVNHILTRVPGRGTFPLKNVLDSTYFFS